MFSKRLIAQVVAVGLVFTSSTACNKLFNKTPPKNVIQSPNIGFETKCLSDVLPVISRYLKGESFVAEVSATWDCFGNAISVFEKKVKGSNQNDFAGREIANFFENYFLKDIAISDSLLIQIMHLKQIFVGGSDTRISKAELLKLVAFSAQMKQITIRLLPYMKVYSLNWGIDQAADLNQSIEYFENSNEAIQQAMRDLSSIIASNNKDYRFENLSSLLHQIENLYMENWPWLEQFDRVLPLVGRLKEAIAGGSEQVIAATEWRRFTLLVARGYIQYLRYYYFIQKAPEASQQVGYFTNSIGDLFSYLGDMVNEKPSKVFTKGELLNILFAVNDLMPNLHFTEEFVTEIMKIKMLLFGGSGEVWRPDDFAKGATKVSSLKELFEKNWPYLSFYVSTWDPSHLSEEEAFKYFHDAETLLNDSAFALGRLFETSYDLQDLAKILEQFDLVVGSGPEGWAHALKKYVPSVIAYKKIVINDTTNLVPKDKWPGFLNFSTRIYAHVLYYNYFIKLRTVFSGSGLNSFDYLAEHSMALLTELVNQRTVAEASVSNEELIELLLALKTAELIPEKISTDTIKKLVQVISGKIFADPTERLNGKIFKGITSAHTKTMLVEYHIWSDIQHAYEKSFFGSGNVELSPEELLVQLKKMDQTVAVKEAEQLYDSRLPLVTDDKMRVLLPLNFKRYDYRSVSNLNMYRALARKVLQSYTGDMGRIFEYKGITEAEMKNFFADFQPLLENLGMIMPGNTNFATNRFLESNLFLPSSDGSDYLNLREGTQLLTMVFSGLEVNKQSEDLMGVQCLVPNTNEQTPSEKVERSPADKLNIDCVLRFYWDHYQEVFSNLPEMSRFLKTLTPIQFHDFMFRMIKATGWKETPARIAFRADTSLLPHIMQYLEAVVLRYDVDKNGILDDNEAEVALPVYAGLIRKFSGSAAYVANKAAFLYMLKYGKVPCGINDVMPIFWKVIQGQKIGIKADRMILSSVFGSIAEKVSGGANAQCPANGTNPPPPPGGVPSPMFTPILGNISPELSLMPILNFN